MEKTLVNTCTCIEAQAKLLFFMIERLIQLFLSLLLILLKLQVSYIYIPRFSIRRCEINENRGADGILI